MAYLTEAEARSRASTITEPLRKSARAVLIEDHVTDEVTTFDVFLSHSSAEPEELLLGIKGLLQDAGLTVYVDRFSDPNLTPTDVTVDTAATLRKRMKQSNSLLYVHSRHSASSKWMPWELGFFDVSKVALEFSLSPRTRKILSKVLSI